jgi:hypothetical protein
MPIDYQLSKVYTIRSPSTVKFYLGTTVNPLSKRFSQHKANYKLFLQNKYRYTRSYDILKLGDAYIELFESYPCNSKEELHKREGELIRLHKDSIVNVNIAGRTVKEYAIEEKDKIKAYREIHKDEIKEQQQNYLIVNKDKIKIQRKNNYEINKIEILEKKKDYYQSNKDEIIAKTKLRYISKKNHSTSNDESK